MNVIVEVPCFNYGGKELVVHLDVEQDDAGDLLIRCPVRQNLYFLTPEERVRQAIIWFLLCGASNRGGWREHVRLEVEQRSLDVAVLLAENLDDDRFAFNIPILIVETKRQERELTGDVEMENQLKTYMKRERCRSGLIFNSLKAIWLSVSGDFVQGSWAKDCLVDLCDAEERLRLCTERAILIALEHTRTAALASAGDFDSLIRLISLTGSDPRLTFTFSVRLGGNLSAVRAFMVQISEADSISYRVPGVLSRNRQLLSRNEFHSLRTVRSH